MFPHTSPAPKTFRSFLHELATTSPCTLCNVRRPPLISGSRCRRSVGPRRQRTTVYSAHETLDQSGPQTSATYLVCRPHALSATPTSSTPSASSCFGLLRPSLYQYVAAVACEPWKERRGICEMPRCRAWTMCWRAALGPRSKTYVDAAYAILHGQRLRKRHQQAQLHRHRRTSSQYQLAVWKAARQLSSSAGQHNDIPCHICTPALPSPRPSASISHDSACLAHSSTSTSYQASRTDSCTSSP